MILLMGLLSLFMAHGALSLGKGRVDKKDIAEEIRKRIQAQLIRLGIPDPLSPPATRGFEDLPLALRYLPRDPYGYPDWTRAMEDGLLLPRDYIYGPEELGKERHYDKDVVIKVKDEVLGDVIFSHRKHNYWLSCDNCHPYPFKEKRGETKFTMYDNWKGKYCGLCHGKVAFMLRGIDNCLRCHTLRRN